MVELDAEKNISLTSVKKEDAKTIYNFYMEDKEELKDIFTFVIISQSSSFSLSHFMKYIYTLGIFIIISLLF